VSETTHHAAFNLQAAAADYERVLADDPEQWDALYLYGTVLLQLGRLNEAITVLKRAATLRPEIPDVHNNLGVAFQQTGDASAAERAYRTAIELNPDFGLAHVNLSRLLESTGRIAEAEISLRRAIHIKLVEARYRLQPAGVPGRQGNFPAVEGAFEEAITNRPENIELQMGLAALLAEQERLDDAGDIYRKVIEQRPDFAAARTSLAFVLERQGRLDDALAASERAVAICPDYAEGQNNLGTVLRSLHRLEEACRAFRRAIELKPDFALAEFNLGTTLLLEGRYAEGWAGYGQHARVAGTAAPGPPSTAWHGQPIPGRRLLLYSDQGLGDALQFVRFVPLCRERSGAKIILNCQAPLVRLFAECGVADEICAKEGPLPAFDFHSSLASLPGLFGVSLSEVGLGVPYLRSTASLPPRIGAILGEPDGRRWVGLVWQGNPRQTRDVVRSCPLETLLPLLEVPGIRFFSLQCESIGRAQLSASPCADRLPDVGGLLADFAETAPVLDRLDLLITVDTAVAHLVGALGRPVWTMLCHTPDWRWHLERSDSPWYPSMRLFRQPVWGDWDSVVQQIRAKLQSG
jgi:tetratricopeptide (TPR) repeat protein